MSIYNTTIWPVIDVAAVCALQNTSGAGSLSLNGTLISTATPNQISFIGAGFIRSVSLTSVNNLSAVNFTISGLQNGAFVTEIITGPNNNTVYGVQYYDIITSVVVSNAVTAVSVGTGKAGYLPLVSLTTTSNNINYSCSIILSVGAGITYSLLQTLEQVNNNWIALNQQTNVFFPSMGLTNATTSQIGNSTAITSYLLLSIVSSTAPTTDTLTFIFTQA